MSEKTGIQWTDHTFNIAWGCTKVSAGCANCYADAQSHRYGFDVWGPGTERRVFGEKHWNEPRKWNRDAEKEGRRRRVFCSSMCDVFEDHPTIDRERVKLWKVIDETPWLDWQILTKRAERMMQKMLNAKDNIWLGVSVEDQKTADERIPLLLRTPASVRFVSYEPALGPVNFRTIDSVPNPPYGLRSTNALAEGAGLHWIIVGGESGPKARPCDVRWIREVVEDCSRSTVKCFVKQLGARPRGWCVNRLLEGPDPVLQDGDCDIEEGADAGGHCGDRCQFLKDRKGGDMAEWPEDLRVRQFPGVPA